MSKFVVEDYKSEPGFSVARLPIFFGLLGVAAIGFGWLASFIGQWFYLVILSPFAMSFCMLIAGIFACKKGKMRIYWLGGLSGLVAGVVAILTMHFFDYQRFLKERAEAGPAINARPADNEPAELAQLWKQIQAVDSLSGYLNMKASQGITLTGRGGTTNLGYVGTWLYWLVELILAAGMSLFGPIIAAGEPYCKACDSWKKQRKLGDLQGDGDEVRTLLADGDIGELAHYHPAPAGGNLTLLAISCPKCQADSSVVVQLWEEVVKKGEESQKRMLIDLTYPGPALPELEALFGDHPSSKTKG